MLLIFGVAGPAALGVSVLFRIPENGDGALTVRRTVLATLLARRLLRSPSRWPAPGQVECVFNLRSYFENSPGLYCKAKLKCDHTEVWKS
ncbi:MAG: hypothetical protein JWP51_4960 [Bradyrhizobium sp.]|nr:hypothetical protein [Bradyrhizobium sp.]